MRHRSFSALLLILLCALASCGTPVAAGVVPVATGSAVPTAGASWTAEAVPSPVAVTPGKGAAPQQFPGTPPPSCQVTLPPDLTFVPPSKVTPFAGYGWYGTAALWTQVRRDGTWRGLASPDGGISDKSFWWREGYDPRSEPQPALVITGRRLDAPAPPLASSPATNAFNAADIGSAMLVGITIPKPGCWEITGAYAGTTLSFIVWIAP